MTVHNHPPMTHTQGLQTDCPRCEQYVDDPLQLDTENLRRVWAEPQTQIDFEVRAKLYPQMVTAQRLIGAFQYEGCDTSTAESLLGFEKLPALTVDQLFDVYYGKVTS